MHRHCLPLITCNAAAIGVAAIVEDIEAATEADTVGSIEEATAGFTVAATTGLDATTVAATTGLGGTTADTTGHTQHGSSAASATTTMVFPVGFATAAGD